MSGITGQRTESGRWVRRGDRILVLPPCNRAPLSRETAWDEEVKNDPPRRGGKSAATRTPTPPRGKKAPPRAPTPPTGKQAPARKSTSGGGGTSGSTQCTEPLKTARTFTEYIDLVRKAETALIACGHKDLEQRLHMLTGIYYGTEWSRDYDVEKNSGRNYAFQGFVAKRYGSDDDPRPCIGCGLYLSLKRSGDAGGVDMGHVLIGMSARMRVFSRYPTIPPTGSTGLEVTTWVGDLAGAAARLAMDRTKDPGTPASKYFRGRDYGATSNLEGDIAGYLVATPSRLSPGPPEIRSGLIADALHGYFVIGINRRDRCRTFLSILGGKLSGGKLTNHAEIRAMMAGKLYSFGRMYMAKYQHQRGRSLGVALDALPLLQKAAEDVAELFISKLLACKL